MKAELLLSIRRDRVESLLDTIEASKPYTNIDYDRIVIELVKRMTKMATRISLRNRQIRDLRRELHR